MTPKERQYHQRFERVIDYIYDHLDEPLDLYRLADIACLSPYHWHRIYREIYGETLAATVKRLRLHRATGMLINSSSDVAEIAKASGYSSVPSFSRAFSECYGIPPVRYRKEGSHQVFRLKAIGNKQSNEGTVAMNKVDIKSIDALELVGIEHIGPYMEIGGAFEKLFAWLGMKGLISAQTRSFGIYCDDPDAVPAEKLRSMACASANGYNPQEEDPVALKVIPACEYAVLRHVGPYADLHSAYKWLYGEWLPGSGREPADLPCFEEYVNDPRQVLPQELITDIYLPLK